MKLRNKLILSCAALAAVATTAVSTTFAWYTSNTTVKASGVSGATQENDDATLLISKTGKVGSWGSKVDLEISPETLVPVAYDATDGTYHTWNPESNDVNTTAATANTHYIQFSLYFKSGSTDSLNVTLTTFTLTETTDALPAKMVLSETGLTQSTAGATYTCNMFRALTYVEEIGASTEVASSSTTNAAFDSTATRKAYDIESFGSLTDSLSSGCNVHNYYNAVKNLTDTEGPKSANKTQSETLEATSPAAGTDGRALGVTGAGSLTGMSPILRIDYTIYLDGWDAYCFDACQGQSFSLAMEFQGSQID